MRETLTDLLEPVMNGLGYELWELEFVPGRTALLRLYIDRPEGIDVDDCERVSRAVSAALDQHDPIPGEYTLEVSSPGLDRVLRKPAHFARFVGEPVKLEMTQPVNGRRRFAGRLLSADEREIGVEVDGVVHQLPISGVSKARLVPVFD